MTIEENRAFVRKTESLTKPVDITAISFLGAFNKYLPLSLQRAIMKKGSATVPYMGFIVDPYCFFLSFAIKDPLAAAALLPDGYELAEAALFGGEEKKPLAIISSFAVRTSVFTGMRVECYLIARHSQTGLLSWIIADYETNTLSHDPKNGFCGYSCDPALFTTTPYGELLAEARNAKRQVNFMVRADIREGETKALDRDLWVEGNLSVGYGGTLRDSESAPFSLIFDPALMRAAKEIPLDRVTVSENGFLPGLIDGKRPIGVALFPWSQHFVIRQDLPAGEIRAEEGLYSQIGVFMDGKGFKTMSGADITTPLFRSMLVSAAFNLGLIAFLLWKAFG